MAVLLARNNAHTLQFKHGGRRYTAALGPVSEQDALRAKLHVERLLATVRAGLTPDPELSRWLVGTGGRLKEALVKAGFSQADGCLTLGAYLDRHARLTTKRREVVCRELRALWGDDRPLSSLTVDDGRAYYDSLNNGRNTRASKIVNARSLMRRAIREGWVPCNPFEGLPTTQTAGNRKAFVSREAIQQVLDACPDAESRLLVSLGRFGGLRMPSEALSIEWSDVDWERERFRVDGKGDRERTVPMFPEIRDAFSDALLSADAGSGWVVSKYRGSRLDELLGRLMRLAGVSWPKPWHNLRASRETELMGQFPVHVVCQWLGNSPEVAVKHYLQATESDFEQAVTRPGESESSAARPSDPAALPTATV